MYCDIEHRLGCYFEIGGKAPESPHAGWSAPGRMSY
jgi:hypothetical protein